MFDNFNVLSKKLQIIFFLQELLSGGAFGKNHFENLTHKIYLVGLHTCNEQSRLFQL